MIGGIVSLRRNKTQVCALSVEMDAQRHISYESERTWANFTTNAMRSFSGNCPICGLWSKITDYLDTRTLLHIASPATPL